MSARMTSQGRSDLLTDEDFNSLAPTQQLILEVLAARHRVGESWWTFDRKFTAQSLSLQSKGWVRVMSGIVENTIRVRLTQAAEQVLLSPTYKSPAPPPSPGQVTEDAKALSVGRAVLALMETLR